MQDYEQRLADFRKGFEALNPTDKPGTGKLIDITTETLVQEALRRYNEKPNEKNFDNLMKLWEKKQNVIDESNADTIIDLGELIEITRSKFESTSSSDEHDSKHIQEKQA